MAPTGFNWTYCGDNQNIGPFRTSGNELLVYFRSSDNSNNNHRGFKLTWSTDELRGNKSYLSLFIV